MLINRSLKNVYLFNRFKNRILLIISFIYRFLYRFFIIYSYIFYFIERYLHQNLIIRSRMFVSIFQDACAR